MFAKVFGSKLWMTWKARFIAFANWGSIENWRNNRRSQPDPKERNEILLEEMLRRDPYFRKRLQSIHRPPH